MGVSYCRHLRSYLVLCAIALNNVTWLSPVLRLWCNCNFLIGVSSCCRRASHPQQVLKLCFAFCFVLAFQFSLAVTGRGTLLRP